MKTVLPRLSLLLFLCSVPSLIGCTTALKHAYYEFRGAQSKIELIEDLPEDALEPYQSVRFTPATTRMGEKICPARLRYYFDQFDATLREELRDEYPGGSPGLVVYTDLIYFQEKGLLSAALCLAHVKLKEDGSDKPVAEFIVKTESKSFREGGRSALAESNVHTLGKFLRNRGLKEKEEEEADEEHDEDDHREKDDD